MLLADSTTKRPTMILLFCAKEKRQAVVKNGAFGASFAHAPEDERYEAVINKVVESPTIIHLEATRKWHLCRRRL